MHSDFNDQRSIDHVMIKHCINSVINSLLSLDFFARLGGKVRAIKDKERLHTMLDQQPNTLHAEIDVPAVQEKQSIHGPFEISIVTHSQL